MRRRTAALALALALAGVAPAAAQDPGRWREVARTPIPFRYFQGVTSAPDRTLFFDGIASGLYRTDPDLSETAANRDVIPPGVRSAEGYNHVGDISWDAREGGRVLLPLECYTPGRPNGGNTCGTGAIGVADPDTLQWRYHVELDPRDIPKAMWNEVSPNGRLIWTSSGDDLLAYRARDVAPAHAAPTGPPLRPVRRLEGAVPPTGVTGAVFYDRRLFLAGYRGELFQVWSVNTRTGARRLEIERRLSGESEGLAAVDLRGGVLHWMIQPISDTGPPTYEESSLLSFFPRMRLRVAVAPHRVPAGRSARFAVRVTARILGERRPVAGAVVRLRGARAKTDAGGRAWLGVRLPRPGRYAVVARRGPDRGRAVVAARP